MTFETKQKIDPRVIVPRPNRMRQLSRQGFGWLDARLHKQAWLSILTPEQIAAYTFLCLVANPQGVSWYRKDRIRADPRGWYEVTDELDQERFGPQRGTKEWKNHSIDSCGQNVIGIG